MRRFTLKRILLGFAAVLVLTSITAAFCWKPLLIEWHKREIVRLRASHSRESRQVRRDAETFNQIEVPNPEAVPAWIQLTSATVDWPRKDYLSSASGWRLWFHKSELCRLGYLSREEFRVGEWILDDAMLVADNCPISTGDPIPSCTVMIDDWADWRCAGASDARDGIRPQGTIGLLVVTDLPSRIPLWKAFVDKHNGEEAVGRAFR